MATDQVQVVHTDRSYEVIITITEKVREVVVGKDYRHVVQEASTPQNIAREVENLQFTTNTKESAITRAINHLNIIKDSE